MVSCKDFWNQRSRSYDAQVGALYETAYEKTVSHTLPYLKPTHRVLDFACGTGLVTLQLAPHVAQVRAIDISNEMVQKLQDKLAVQGVSNVFASQTDLFDPSLEPGSFDVVLAFNVLCYVEPGLDVLRRIHSLLRPGGWFLSATDCLGDRPTLVGLKKLWKSRTGAMPYVAFYSVKGLKRRIEGTGFTLSLAENLFPAPPNLYVAAQKPEGP